MTEQNTTKRIKARLKRYADMLRDIVNQQERLAQLYAVYGAPAGPNLSGLPHSGGISDPTGSAVMRKDEIQNRIKRKQEQAAAERAAIEATTDRMADPDEGLVIQMRYIDLASWPDITFALFGKLPDYFDKMEAYERRTYRIHGRALLSFGKIEEPQSDSKCHQMSPDVIECHS